jgi:arginyl-tRNA--protein-N-Asp/Glu arginylyltransferase
MFAAKLQPEHISPEQLDDFLASGWYRMGQMIFTTHFLNFGYGFLSSIWIRLPLEGFSFGKSNQKLIRKNLGRFRCAFREASLGPEKDALFEHYRQHFPETLPSSLQESLLEGERSSIFNTMEFVVYDEDRLVAASFFDLGKTSIASILGMYHPDYARYSLGFFTILMEIQFGIENGFSLFYPGYVVPGNPRFDYKLRIGSVDYFNLQKQAWLPIAELAGRDIPINLMRSKLRSLSSHLKRNRIPYNILENLFFEFNLMVPEQKKYLDYPILLYLKYDQQTNIHHIVVFDPRNVHYQLLACTNASQSHDTAFEYQSDFYLKEKYLHNDVLIREILISKPDTQTFFKSIKSAGY